MSEWREPILNEMDLSVTVLKNGINAHVSNTARELEMIEYNKDSLRN